MRAKQAQEQGHDHTLIHIQHSGLKDISPKQTTWLCTTCLSRGTTAKVTVYNCDPSTRSITRARWWANLSPAQKQTLATAVQWTDDQLKEKDAFFVETVKQSKPHKPTNTKHYNQRLKEQRSSWRNQHGRSTDARKATGAANANTTFVAIPKRSLHLSRARAAKSNQDQTQEKKQGLKRHWQDLTEQGIEPNPGPRFHSNTNLNIWQINIRSFHQRGWDVLNMAKKENIQVFLLQETFLTQDQGNSIARSSKDWHFFHYPSLATQNSPHGRRPTGGVAIAVHKSINCSQATGYHNQAGEWLRIAVGPTYITSAYRQPNATAQHKEAWNKTLSEDLASIGATTWFCGGDFNHEPITDDMTTWSATLGADVIYPTTSPDPNNPDNLDPDFADQENQPAATRWASNNCLDWSIQKNNFCPCQLRHEKFADHKLIHYRGPPVFVINTATRRFPPSPNYEKPETIPTEQWESTLAQKWHAAAATAEPMNTWEAFTITMDNAFRRTMRKFWTELSPQQQRHFQSNHHKPQQAKTQKIYRHHRSHPQNSTSTRCARLRRFWRRHQEMWNHNNSNRDHHLKNLQTNLERDARDTQCPYNPAEAQHKDQCAAWIEQQILHEKNRQQTARIQAWRSRLRTKPKAIWQWLARDKATAPVTFVQQQDLYALRQYWRDIWPTEPSAQHQQEAEARHIPWPHQHEPILFLLPFRFPYSGRWPESKSAKPKASTPGVEPKSHHGNTLPSHRTTATMAKHPTTVANNPPEQTQ